MKARLIVPIVVILVVLAGCTSPGGERPGSADSDPKTTTSVPDSSTGAPGETGQSGEQGEPGRPGKPGSGIPHDLENMTTSVLYDADFEVNQLEAGAATVKVPPTIYIGVLLTLSEGAYGEFRFDGVDSCGDLVRDFSISLAPGGNSSTDGAMCDAPSPGNHEIGWSVEAGLARGHVTVTAYTWNE